MITPSSCLIWQIIGFILPPNENGCVYAWTTLGSACDRLTEDSDFGGYINKHNCRICGTENPHAYIEKPTHPKRVTVECGFWSRGIIRSFFFENKEGEAVTVNGDRYRAMLNELLFTKIEEEDIGNILFQQQNSMFCALFLKIALLAAELMSFGHLGAVIWHHWTIICGVPSKISVTPTSQRQLML